MLRALARMLDLGDVAGSRRFWLAPAGVLVATILVFFVIGEVTAAPLYVSLPNGAVIALVMAGLCLACMSPAGDDPPDDPPRNDDDVPVLGSPGGPWTVLTRLGPSAGTEPALDVVRQRAREQEPAAPGTRKACSASTNAR